MNPRAALALLLIVLSCAHGQIITLPPGPYSPGQTIQVSIYNNLGINISLPCLFVYWMQGDDGTPVVTPPPTYCAPPFPAGTTVTGPFWIPGGLPGSTGSFVFRACYAAVRLDVGAPAASFRALHPYILGGPNTTQSSFHKSWEFTNTTAVSHTFVAGDEIRIFAPGGVVPLATTSLAGLPVQGNFSLTGDLPLDNLAPGPTRSRWRGLIRQPGFPRRRATESSTTAAWSSEFAEVT